MGQVIACNYASPASDDPLAPISVPPATRFLRELEDHLSEEEAERETVINWGRRAEIFAYDYDTEVLSLENF